MDVRLETGQVLYDNSIVTALPGESTYKKDCV